MIMDLLDNVFGPAPLDYEFLPYILSFFIFMYLFDAVLYLFSFMDMRRFNK